MSAPALIDEWLDFFRTYYHYDVCEMARQYPSEQRSLYIEASDLHKFDAALLDEWLEAPRELQAEAEEALGQYDHPIDVTLGEEADIHIRLVDSAGEYVPRVSVGEITADHVGQYVGLEGQLGRVTGVTFRAEVLAYECLRCGILTKIPQSRASVQEPHECRSCERQGPFDPDFDQSELIDQRKAMVEEPPEDRSTGRGEGLTTYVEDDLVAAGGPNGLPDRAGEPVTVFGEIRPDKSTLSGQNASPETEAWLDAHAFAFDRDTAENIDLELHREEIEEIAAREDAIEQFAASIEPALYRDEDLETVLEAAVAWLVNAYRINPEGGSSSRGDLHMCLIGDPGMGKSKLMKALHELAPKSEYRSGTGLSAVGLTAAAVQEEFAGSTEWVLDPGILPRANGGHCIIDEVDAVVDEKTKAIHDALEGEQMVKIDKAGIKADLPTRTALLASGNPIDGRFNRYEPIPPQIDLDPALISRMDLLFAIQDEVDEEADRAKAEHVLDSWDESSREHVAQLQGVPDPEPAETDRTDAPVATDTLRAWIKHAREHVFPVLTPEAKARLEEFYVEIRDLNDGDDDAPIPATLRSLEAGIRIATAYARVELSDTVEPRHAERAIDISRQVVGVNFDPESGEFDASRVDTGKPKSQRERIRTLKDLVGELADEYDDGAPVETVIEEAEEVGLKPSKAEHEIEKLKQQGELHEPAQGRLRGV